MSRSTPTTNRLASLVLVLTPGESEAELLSGALNRAGIPHEISEGMTEFCGKLGEEAGAGLLTDEVLSPEALDRLNEALDRQPPWSEFPIVLLSEGEPGGNGSGAVTELMARRNIRLLNRHADPLTVAAALRFALRDRRRQRKLRERLEAGERAAEALREGRERHVAETKRWEEERERLMGRERVLQEQLAEADQRKDDFLAMLAHELRNPLAPIRNAVEVMRLRGTQDPTLQWSRDVVERQIGQMARLVDDLLDVSRITRGDIELRKEPAELATIVARAAETASPLMEARSHSLIISLPRAPVLLEVDVLRLEQVLTNLLTNAAKFTEPGGRIWVTAPHPEGSKGEIELRVRDSGIGIEPQRLPQIFDLFAQVDRSLGRKQGGLGIGLTLSRRLVEMHGGTLTVESEGPGMGSEFILRLPVLRTARPAAPAARPQVAKPEGSLPVRVLVVDDNVDAAESIALLLQMMGHEVQVAHSGETAIDEARRRPPDVVLLDIGMPGMDGYEVARALRGQVGLERVGLVAMTGYGQDEDRRRSKETGFDDHLVKPVELDVLKRILTRYRNRKQAGK